MLRNQKPEEAIESNAEGSPEEGAWQGMVPLRVTVVLSCSEPALRDLRYSLTRYLVMVIDSYPDVPRGDGKPRKRCTRENVAIAQIIIVIIGSSWSLRSLPIRRHPGTSLGVQCCRPANSITTYYKRQSYRRVQSHGVQGRIVRGLLRE